MTKELKNFTNKIQELQDDVSYWKGEVKKEKGLSDYVHDLRVKERRKLEKTRESRQRAYALKGYYKNDRNKLKKELSTAKGYAKVQEKSIALLNEALDFKDKKYRLKILCIWPNILHTNRNKITRVTTNIKNRYITLFNIGHSISET